MAKEKATVLSFEKKLVVSDGIMTGTTWDKRYEEETPVKIKEKTVKGTNSARQKETILNDPMKLNAKITTANIQTIDSAYLQPTEDTLKVNFTLKVLSGVQYPSACNNKTRYKEIVDMCNKYINKESFKELAKRYALNIANGRYLWKNRVGAEKIEVKVSVGGEIGKEGKKEWTFNAYKYSLKGFDTVDKGVEELAQIINDTLCGIRDFVIINVTASALIGKGQEVYPSEELIPDRKKDSKTGQKSKILYEENGYAALHSQKIGNAIRTIDTWYPEYKEVGMPIAVEPYGTVASLAQAYRGGNGKDFYKLFDTWSRGKELDTKEDEDYVMAVLIRGGVFGEE